MLHHVVDGVSETNFEVNSISDLNFGAPANYDDLGLMAATPD